MKKLIIITISFFAMVLGGCNFYTDVDADWHGEEAQDGSDCDQLLVLLQAEDEEARRAELAAEYSRCAGADPGDEDPDGDTPGNDDCVYEDGSDCRDNPDDGECTDGQCDVDPNQIDCEQVRTWVSGHTAEEALHFCADMNLSEDRCLNIVEQCLGEDWTPGGDDGQSGGADTDALCQMAYDALEDVNISPNDLTSDEAFELCMSDAVAQSQNGQVDESICRDIADRCFASGSSSPNDGTDTCESLIQQANGFGVDPPTTQEEANAIHAQCLDVSQDPQVCDELIRCYGFMP